MRTRGTGAHWQEPGRVRFRLMKLLEKEGFTDVEISAPQGRERSDVRQDIYRWQGWGTRDGARCSLCSWDTMTSCLRGIEVHHAVGDPPTSFDIYALKPVKHPSVKGRT